MSQLLQDAAARAIRYLDDIRLRAVVPSPAAIAALRQLEEPLPASPTDPEETLRLLDEIGSPASMGMAGPRFFGFVTGGSLPVTLGANWLGGAWDQVAFLHRTAPGSPERTRNAIARLQEEGTCWCGETLWQGRTAMRISVSSWATTDADVEKSANAMIRAARSAQA